ncbi:unnamed protein product [Rotaria magnacalcarata]|uniref:UBC core domain-containing protein n=2 Tax=Rotaria magnacalcarata TaxID=392030 RepID=A0A816YE00_9BILA|nr:unnamed protein product [Rotaria magnacalcarata]
MTNQSLLRSRGRLQKELMEMGDTQSEGIFSWIVDEIDGFVHMEAIITGPSHTPYEHGKFLLDILIRMDTLQKQMGCYPFVPPEVRFFTKIFHPNISTSGEVCIDILSSEWYASMTIRTMLLSVQSLLAAPNFDDFIQPEAAFLYKENPEDFNRKAKEWTEKYATGENSFQHINEGGGSSDAESTQNTASLPTNEVVELNLRTVQPIDMFSLARLTAYQYPQEKTRQEHRFKGHASVIAECLNITDNPSNLSRHEISNSQYFVDHFDTGGEIDKLILTIENEQFQDFELSQSKVLINDLRGLKDMSSEKVVQGYLRLYLMEASLMSKLNEIMLEPQSKKFKEFAPLVRLLYYVFNHPSSMEAHGITVYHGMDLSTVDINTYKMYGGTDTTLQWIAFISATRNLELAERFDTNTLFIMQLKKTYTNGKHSIDVNSYSKSPQEEEILLMAGIEFAVRKVLYDNEKQQHKITLDVYV